MITMQTDRNENFVLFYCFLSDKGMLSKTFVRLDEKPFYHEKLLFISSHRIWREYDAIALSTQL